MKDQISALIDDELSLEGSEHLYTAVKAGGEFSECWATYHLIGDAMRGSPIFKPGFNERLMQKLDAEPTVLAPRRKAPSLLRSSPMWSMAASVAAVMFVGWMVLQQQVQHKVDAAPVEVAQNDADNSVPTEYLLAHQEYSPNKAAYYIQPAAYSENSK